MTSSATKSFPELDPLEQEGKEDCDSDVGEHESEDRYAYQSMPFTVGVWVFAW